MANGGDKPPFVKSRNSADLRTFVNYLKRRQTEETSGSENVESPKYFKTPRPRSDMPQELDGEVKTLNKQVFEYLEKVNGRNVNILEGLELHHGVFSSEEQERIVDLVYQLEKMGKNGQLKGEIVRTAVTVLVHSLSPGCMDSVTDSNSV
ncbi:2-oxoglutarate (2OG) and Fe(II)-dependent oxygenase superfamily protein [Tanacetum coccineum]